MNKPIRVGIFGNNGHQIHQKLVNHSRAQLVATASFPVSKLSSDLQADSRVVHYETLEELLKDERIDLVSLCSPHRKDQARHTLATLKAGKHVYAEKPSAMDETDLDEILKVSRETGCHFHEMAGTAFEHPYVAMRRLVASGKLGTVVQVLAEKSYPYHESRPQNDGIDGGIICQSAIQGLRMVEHVAQMPILSLEKAMQSTLGNPVEGGALVMASSLQLKLSNGGLATVSANYLNPSGTGAWGYDSLRILGTKGFVESSQGGRLTRVVIEGKDGGTLEEGRSEPDYFEKYISSLLEEDKMPLGPEEEVSPTRWAIRARKSLGTS